MVAVLHRFHRCQVRRHGLGVLGVHRGLIQERLVEGADLAMDVLGGRRDRRRGGRFFQDGADAGFRQVPKDIDRAVPGEVSRDLGALQIAAVGVGEEVGPRLDRGVPAREVEAPGAIAVCRQIRGGEAIGGQNGCGGGENQRECAGRGEKAGLHGRGLSRVEGPRSVAARGV